MKINIHITQTLSVAVLVLVLLSLLKVQLVLNNTATGYLGFILFVIILFLTKEPLKSNRYCIPVLSVLALTFFIPGNTLFYILLSLSFLLGFEVLIGRTSILALLSTLFMSSIFAYLSNIYTFSIRLTISRIAANILKLFFQKVELQGTIFKINDSQIVSVEDVCMGLNMINVGMLITVFLMAYYQYRMLKKAPSLMVLGVIIFSFLMVILGNLTRILCLAIYDLKENNLMHELVGLICFVFYLLTPLVYFIPKIYQGWGLDLVNNSVIKKTAKGSSLLTMFMVLTFYFINYFNLEKDKSLEDRLFGVQKFEEKDAVIYKKPIPDFYSAEHNPLFCWKGEGYRLISIEIKKWDRKKYYFGKLEKKGQVLYSAWWFSDGKTQTTDQEIWRWRALYHRKKFFLINITTSSQNSLQKYLRKYYDQV